MARRTKDAPKSAGTGAKKSATTSGRTTGRVTPKGGHKPAPKPAPITSGRYTPPIPKAYKESPRWIPVLLLSLLILGMCTIVSNYLGLLPGGAKNAYLFVGLGFITLGFITATRYR
jgi:hypothetical protein